MTRLNIIWKTLTITKNPFSVLSIKRYKNKKAITFRNGLTYTLDWPQFRIFRDVYSFLAKYSITQMNNDLFRIKDQRGSEVVCNCQLMPVICNLMEDFTINQTDEDTFQIKKENFEAVGSKDMLICVQELETGEYECDYRNKVVLDIGGFEGESAVYFWSKKAKKIIIYEPVATNIQFIEKNIILNKINAELHSTGIGNKNGTYLIEYNEIDPGFGFLSKGSKNMEVKIRDVTEVIQESGAAVAKFDCEGAEVSLVNVPVDILRRIEYYIIETHALEIRCAIIEKFQKAGFKLEKETCKTPSFSVLTFKIKGEK